MWYGDEDEREDRLDWKSPLEFTRGALPEIKETFSAKVRDKSQGLALYGTVPPPKKFPMEKLNEIAEIVAKTIKELNPDGVVVYDIQDEPSRNGAERPFPFFETHEPRIYGSKLKSLTGIEPIIYHALISGQAVSDFEAWIGETVDHFKIGNFVIVGSRPKPGESILSVDQACKLIQAQNSETLLGGIVIAERHRDRQDEPERIQAKVAQGATFFTSQIIYNVDNAIWMLRDYSEFCEKKKIEPIRMVFTFAPFGSDRTVKFMEWLGVEVPVGTVKRVLSRPDAKTRLAESMNICWENWRRILEAAKTLPVTIPLGFSVEAVSKSALEQEGVTHLYHSLKALMDTHYNPDPLPSVIEEMISHTGAYIVQNTSQQLIVSLLKESGPEVSRIVTRHKSNSHPHRKRVRE